MSARYAIIIPACNEEPCLGLVLDELNACIDLQKFVVAVGVNGSTDGTARVSREHGALTAVTGRRGYGHGCLSAIELVKRNCPEVAAFIFFAADGANDPTDLVALTAAFELGFTFVLGSRTTLATNWPVMSLQHVLANGLLGMWVGLLTGKFFRDIGPFRIIERSLFDAMQLREYLYGWTMEAQVRAVQLSARICEVPVRERRRLAGTQKVSRVSWQHSLRIGTAIIAAGWRTRLRSRASS